MGEKEPQLTDLQQQAVECAQKFCAVSGKPGTGKTETLLARSLALLEKSGTDSVLIISPHSLSAQNIIIRLKKTSTAPLPAVSDIFSFACKVAGDERQRISALGVSLILRTLSRSIQFHSRLNKFSHLPGFVESLSQIVTRMRQADISGESLRLHSQRSSDVLRDLALVLEQYEKVLLEKKLADKRQIMDSARELIEKEKATLPHHILIDDSQDFSPVEMSLISALAKRCETAFFTIESCEGHPPEGFLASLLGEIPKLFAFDKTFGAFASFPNSKDVFETHLFTDAISESLWVADKITELKNKPENADSSYTVIAQDVNSLLLFADEFSRRAVAFYSLPHHLILRDACARASLSLLGALTDSPGRHLLDLLRLPKVSASDEILTRLKDGFEKEDPVQLLRSVSESAGTEGIKTLISLIDALTGKKDSLKLREVVDCASKLIPNASPLLEEFADEFDLCFEGGTPVGSLYDAVSQSLTFWSKLDAPQPAHLTIEGSARANLHILLPTAVSCAETDFLFMPGLQEGAFSTARERLLTLEEESAIEQPAATGAAPATAAVDEREYLFERCASRAKCKLFLSCHRTEPDREFLPSPFLREVSPDYASRTLEAFSGFAAKAELETEKKRRRTEKPFSLDRNLPLSASSINDYLACPRMFYFAYILRIPELFISPNMVIGSVMHNVMKELRQPGSRGVPPDIEKANGMLENQLSDRAQDFRTPAELEGARRRCVHLLSEYLKLEDDWQSEVHAAEQWFEWKLCNFNIVGRIDRIDRTDEGFEIVDYKLSGNKKGKGLKNKFLVKKEDFQLPIYYWAAREGLGLDVSAFSYVFFDFNRTGLPEKVTLQFCEDGKADAIIPLSQMENAKERLAEILEEIFTPRIDFPIGEDAPCTEYVRGCPYRSICAKAQH